MEKKKATKNSIEMRNATRQPPQQKTHDQSQQLSSEYLNLFGFLDQYMDPQIKYDRILIGLFNENKKLFHKYINTKLAFDYILELIA